MRKVKRWRYYCDHCKKSGSSAGAMNTHEKHCCANPLRECRMCNLMSLVQQPMNDLIAALTEGGLPKLREMSGGGNEDGVEAWAMGCPACNLAAIVQARKQNNEDKTIDNYHDEFDYKADTKHIFAELTSLEDRY